MYIIDAYKEILYYSSNIALSSQCTGNKLMSAFKHGGNSRNDTKKNPDFKCMVLSRVVKISLYARTINLVLNDIVCQNCSSSKLK